MAPLLRTLDAIERVLIALLAGTALLLACIAMLGRYVLPGLMLDWTFEVTIFTTIWATFLAGARSAGTGEHVRVDTLLTYLPFKVRTALVLLAGLLGIATALFLLRSGWIVVEEAYRWDERTTSSLGLPLWIYYLSLPVGAALLVFHLVVRCLGIATGRIRDDLAQHAG
jgi:TRAP-type C4-dicarboxylate transport system permease small subunit